MRELLSYYVTERTENHLRIVLAPRAGAGITQVTGVVRGPFSDLCRTLTADSPIKPGFGEGSFDALVVEPCYWTPKLPFWYDLRLTVCLENGALLEEVVPLGIKRFSIEGDNFRLEGKRVVLRGMCIERPVEGDLALARKYETALTVKRVNESICASADRIGVPLIVDLRERQPACDLFLDWHPAVMMVLVSLEQTQAVGLKNFFSAACVAAGDQKPIVASHAYAVELQPDERPAPWTATCDKPVIAIRSKWESDIRMARSGCDRLQAELAPEFDLAGYFV